MAQATAASDSLVIKAPVETIRGALLDFESYPDWMKNVKGIEVLKKDTEGRGKHVQYTVDAIIKKVTYTLDYDYSDDEITIGYVEGDLKDVSAKYVFETIDDDSTRVSYEFGLEVAFPVPGLKSVVQKRASKMIISAALKDLKKRAESLA